MKRRHPKQVVDHTKFRPGDEYVLIQADKPESTGGAIISCERMTFVETLGNGELAAVLEALSRRPAEEHEIRLTMHEIHGLVTAASWGWNDAIVRRWAFFDMDHPYMDKHIIFVPLADWKADPHVHVVAWLNPDDACEPGLIWAEEEARLRRRRDTAMRKALGFE